MKIFDEQLLRLKQAAGMTADQDVAALLGMTKAAFFQRKSRNAFPEEKLLALSARRPELGLDVTYVMTGQRPEDVRQHMQNAEEVTSSGQSQTDILIAKAVALLRGCTANELDTLVIGVLAMGNEMMRHRGFRMPGVTTWHKNDTQAAVRPAAVVTKPKKKAI